MFKSIVFTESAPRPIQSISHDVSDSVNSLLSVVRCTIQIPREQAPGGFNITTVLSNID